MAASARQSGVAAIRCAGLTGGVDAEDQIEEMGTVQEQVKGEEEGSVGDELAPAHIDTRYESCWFGDETQCASKRFCCGELDETQAFGRAIEHRAHHGYGFASAAESQARPSPTAIQTQPDGTGKIRREISTGLRIPSTKVSGPAARCRDPGYHDGAL